MIRGIMFVFGGNVRLLAGDVCPRGWSSRSAMRGTPCGQRGLSPESPRSLYRPAVENGAVGLRGSPTGSGFDGRCDIDPRDRRPRMWQLGKMRGWIRVRSIHVAGTRNERIADFEHAFETERPIRRNRLAQGILGDDDPHSRRLTVIPFHQIVRPVRADHAVSCGDLVPEQSFWRARPADPGDIDGEAIGMRCNQGGGLLERVIHREVRTATLWPLITCD